eukprot:scaffold105765_cov17-Tisochrysis_lutea.AAC.2
MQLMGPCTHPTPKGSDVGKAILCLCKGPCTHPTPKGSDVGKAISWLCMGPCMHENLHACPGRKRALPAVDEALQGGGLHEVRVCHQRLLPGSALPVPPAPPAGQER